MQAIKKCKSNGPFFWEAYIPVRKIGIQYSVESKERSIHGVLRDLTQDRISSEMIGGIWYVSRELPGADQVPPN